MMMMCTFDHACYLKCKLDVYSAVVETINQSSVQHLQQMDDSRKTDKIHQANIHPKQPKARWKDGNCLETGSTG
jgi:hypothetical protein